MFARLDEDLPEVVVNEHDLARVLAQIKQNSRNRRLAMIAPVALAVAVVSAMIAAPPQYGGLTLSEADASGAGAELPRVFGANGVWRLAEPIADSAATAQAGPAAVVEAPSAPSAPAFVLSPPSEEELQSLPTSTSTPPTSTSGQALTSTAGDVSPDVRSFSAAIRIGADAAPSNESAGAPEAQSTADQASSGATAEAPVVAGDADPGDPAGAVTMTVDLDSAQPSTGEHDVPTLSDGSKTEDNSSTPASAASAEDTTTPDTSSIDEDVTAADSPQSETTGLAEQSVDEAGDLTEANPSTPPADPADRAIQAPSVPATIVQRSVLVHSAHVSVMVQVVDDDSSVIDWCNTRVDWGDGSVTWVADTDGVAACAASCEHEVTPSDTGIDVTLEFNHEYAEIIDASPRIFVATGDGCSYDLAELQLAPFTVDP